MRKALEVDPNYMPSQITYVMLLRELGRLNEAFEVTQRVVGSADPRLKGFRPIAAMLSAQLGRFDYARAEIDEMLRLDPDGGRGVVWTVAFWWEDPAAALPKLRALEAAEPPEQVACQERILQRLVAALAPGPAIVCPKSALDWEVRMRARQGDIDGAYAALARPLPNSRGPHYLLFYPEMKAFRRDPRFMPLAKRLGLTDYWLASNRWPDFCVEPDLPYDCKAEARKLAQR